MRIIDPGHTYELAVLDLKWWQFWRRKPRLVFVKRMGEKYPGNTLAYSGTTLQEVLRVCINRVQFVNGQIPDFNNEDVVYYLRAAILKLEKRAHERHGIPFSGYVANIENVPVNSHGHIWKEGQ